MSDAIYGYGHRLKELRKKHNLMQKTVAERLGIHPNTLRGYENNSLTPSLENLVDLAVLYNTSTDYILGLTKRANIYIDDCTPEQQKLILELIKVARDCMPNS